jgi:GNAT superfamily N-acetyltransferase
VQIEVRPGTKADVDFLTDVVVEATRDQGRLPDDLDEAAWRAGFAEWTQEQVAGRLADSSTSVVVVDGQPVGRLRVVRRGNVIELAGIQLLPSVQSRGVGASLVAALAAEARAAGLPLVLGVENDNPRARAFYERCGLRHVGDDGNEHKMRLD